MIRFETYMSNSKFYENQESINEYYIIIVRCIFSLGQQSYKSIIIDPSSLLFTEIVSY